MRINVVVALLIIIFVCGIIFAAVKSNSATGEVNKVSIAVCPTYHFMADALNEELIDIYKTASTAESLELLKNNSVDYVLSGRRLKPHEGDYDSKFIAKKGYSFLADKEKVIFSDELVKVEICTDLPIEVLRYDIESANIVNVASITSCPSKELIVTSWDNTDYSKADIAHIINRDGSRFDLSRTPMLFCKEMCPQNIINQLKIAYEK